MGQNPSHLDTSQEAPDQSSFFRSPLTLSLVALMLGLLFEILFDGHTIGISFFIWATACVVALMGLAASEGVRPSRPEVFISLGILVFAGLTFFREEPMSVFLAIWPTLFLFGVWIHAFHRGRVIDYGWLDFTVATIQVPVEGWLRPWPVASSAWRQVIGEREARSGVFALLRGILLAFPLVVIFLGLLVSADMIFADYVEEALRWLDIERIARFIRRLFVVILSALFFLGVLVAALRDSGKRKLIGFEKPVVSPFLGFVEAAVILASVDLLFAAFVAVQFTYLFGGEANITAAGYTYSEYARRGFGELTFLAFLSLGLIMALGSWTKRQAPRQRAWFNGLSASLVGFMGVILFSALKRLLLYEAAYGFTRLRTYTHVAIVWLGIMFAVFLILLFLDRLRRFAPAAVLGMLGFALTVNLLNVDAFIVRQNMRRFQDTGDIDLPHMILLSTDALPALIGFVDELPSDTQEELLPQLACQREMLEEHTKELSWQSTHWSRAQAAWAFESVAAQLDSYEVEHNRDGWFVHVNGDDQLCYAYRYWD
ncbi:MAG: DUF4173 domain-containing protein [Anaerolineales bacterium]|nr:DUF4173 domain-containing protein [Anaerolineales bacterium]